MSIHQKEEPILEFSVSSMYPVDIEDNDIVFRSGNNQWIFPWKFKNVYNSSIILPKESYGILQTENDSPFIIKNIIVDKDEYCPVSISVKATGLFPKRIKKGDKIAKLYVVRKVECHKIPYSV